MSNVLRYSLVPGHLDFWMADFGHRIHCNQLSKPRFYPLRYAATFAGIVLAAVCCLRIDAALATEIVAPKGLTFISSSDHLLAGNRYSMRDTR